MSASSVFHDAGLPSMLSREGRICSRVFLDPNLLPLVLNYLAAPNVDRVVRPVPDSLPNNRAVSVLVSADVDVRHLKVRAALDALPGVLRGMAALSAVCRSWREHVAKDHFSAVQRLLGHPPRPAENHRLGLLELYLKLQYVFRKCIADFAHEAFTEPLPTSITNASDELVRQCNKIYDRITYFSILNEFNVREFQLDVDDHERVDPAKALRLTEVLSRREGFRINLPARDDAIFGDGPVDIATYDDEFFWFYCWSHDALGTTSSTVVPYLVDGNAGVLLPRMRECEDTQNVELWQLVPPDLMPAAAKEEHADIESYGIEFAVNISITAKDGLTVAIQGWARDLDEPGSEPFFEVALSLSGFDDVRVRYRDPQNPTIANAELTMAAMPKTWTDIPGPPAPSA